MCVLSAAVFVSSWSHPHALCASSRLCQRADGEVSKVVEGRRRATQRQKDEEMESGRQNKRGEERGIHFI